MTSREHDSGPEAPSLTVDVAHAWLSAVTSTSYVPMSVAELDALLVELTETLVRALTAEPFSAKVGVEVGTRMVAGQLVGLDTLERSVQALVSGLVKLTSPERLTALLGALCAGYAAALRKRTLEQQEDMKRALLSAKQRAERVMQATENRFREVFNSSPVGIAITNVDGRFFEVNPALSAILASPADELANRCLPDYFDRDEPGSPFEPLRGRRKLVRADGESAWVYVSMSPLREGPGDPESYVTTVQDLSELQLLQGRFGHQLLHDALTGVANRLYFESALETRVGRARSDATITLCCVNLDAFSVINDGLGHEVGDRLLRTVAKRLEAAMADEKALVARTGGDEFAILIEDSPETPDIPQLVARINEALAEPEYVDNRGIAIGATVGAVRCLASDMSAPELFRAADAALHNAKATGRRQWMGFDRQRDELVRQNYRDAAALPGASENGELEVNYQPVVRLSDRQTVAFRATLCWPGRADGPLAEDRTMELAESTGYSVLCGPWMLRTACESLSMLGAGMCVRLSRLQSADDDLVAAVLKAIAAGEVPAHLLEIAFDTGAVLDEFGSTQDNLEVVADIGVRPALWRFNGGPRELAVLAHSSVRSVILADSLAGKDDAVIAKATEALVGSLKEIGAEVSVDGVRTGDEADWWAEAGVDTAQGPLFGEPADLQTILSGQPGR